MTQSELRVHNSSYLGITLEQSVKHERLMVMKTSEWPIELKEYMKTRGPIYSGDQIACVVADWLNTK